MKRNILIGSLVTISLLISCGIAKGQESKKLYDPALDGMKQIKEALSAIKGSGKHLLIQYGGNWCTWCKKFDAFCKSDAEISKIISDNYLWIMLNYSPENKNLPANEYLGNPKRFGFPVLIIVDSKGKVLHVQDSAFLEEGQGYNKENVTRFLQNWTASAIIPEKPSSEPSKK